MNEKAQKKLDDILIKCGYSHKETKEVIKRYDKNTDQLFKLGKIDYRKEDTNGEIVEKIEVSEIVTDEIIDIDIDKLIKIENLRLQCENNKLLNQIQMDLKNFYNIRNDVDDIKKNVNRNATLVDYFSAAINKIDTMKNIMIFWLILTIISLIGSIYTAVKIGEFIGKLKGY